MKNKRFIKQKRTSELESALDVLQAVFKKSKGSFSSEFLRLKLEQEWENLVGKDLAKDTHPRKIYKSTLYITAASSEAMYHFRFSSDFILSRINRFIDPSKNTIEHLSFSPPRKKADKNYSQKSLSFLK